MGGTAVKEDSVALGQAKTHLSELVDRVRREALVVTITRHGRPVARLVPLEMVPAGGHLADAKGWLDDDDTFFDGLRGIVRDRSKHHPRAARFDA